MVCILSISLQSGYSGEEEAPISTPGYATGITVSGMQYAYVADKMYGVRIIDVTTQRLRWKSATT